MGVLALSSDSDSLKSESSSKSRPHTDPLLNSEVYSKSLRFSHISRPELVIDRSSPVKQNIGDFVDEEEKILALFKVDNQTTRRASRTPSVASL